MSNHSTESSRNRLRGGISLMLSFLLCLFLTLLALAILAQATVLSPGFMKKQVEKSEYVAHVMEDMEEIFVSYGISSDFDETFFTTVMDEAQVTADVYKEIDKLYGASSGADIDAFEKSLYQKLMENVQAREIEATDSVRQAVGYLAEICADTYQEGVALPLASYASGALQAAKKPVLFGLIGLSALTLFVLGFLFSLQRKNSVRYGIYACSGAALTLVAGILAVLLSGRIERVGITGKALYYFVVTYIRQALVLLGGIAGVLLVLIAVLSIVYGVARKKVFQQS